MRVKEEKVKRITLALAAAVIMVGAALVVGGIAPRDVLSPATAQETTSSACGYWTWDWYLSAGGYWYWQYYRTCYGPGGSYTEWGDWDWW